MAEFKLCFVKMVLRRIGRVGMFYWLQKTILISFTVLTILPSLRKCSMTVPE